MSTPFVVKFTKLKRGETLLKSGERPKNIYIVKSGRVSVMQSKGGKNVELFQADVSHTLAEELVQSAGQWGGFTVLALKDTQLIELPAVEVKAAYDTVPPAQKAFLKGLLERVKATSSTLREIKTQKDQSPCPPETTARTFGVILHTAKAVGKPVDSTMVADWQEFKSFTTEVFQEPLQRIEEAVCLVVKLGYAELKLDPVNPDQGQIIFKDLVPIENFFEFYHTYYFKGTHAELLKTNEKASRITHEFLKIAESGSIDRAGMVSLPFKPTIDAMKAAFDGRFEPDQLFALQAKGLMVKMTPTSDGGVLTFYKQDFLQMLICWRFLKEIENWNELGYVDASTPVAAADQGTAVGEPASRAERREASPEEAAPQRPKPKRDPIQPPTNDVRHFKKHDIIFEAGDLADRVYVLQAGLVSLLMERGDSSVELSQSTAPQLLGEEVLWGVKVREYSSIALNDTSALELSLPNAEAMIESFPGSIKVLVKSLINKQKAMMGEVVEAKVQTLEPEPCAPAEIPKLFAIIYHAAISTGKTVGERLTVVWAAYRKYCHWGFLESPVQLEQTLQLLARLGYAELEMVKSDTDPNAPDELGFVHFKSIEDIQLFYRFYLSKKAMGFDAIVSSLEETSDPAEKKYREILKAIRAWNQTGVVAPVLAGNKAA